MRGSSWPPHRVVPHLLCVVTALVWASEATAQRLTVRLATGTGPERTAEAQLRRIVTAYDLTPWWFTDQIEIAQGEQPHSHPVLTLNTSRLDDDVAQLATLLHEQIHWFLIADTAATEAAIADLRLVYPSVPVGGTDGARSEFSTYLHLLTCWLELDALAYYVGEPAARDQLGAKGHYRWIYRTVLRDTESIGDILRRHRLIITP